MHDHPAREFPDNRLLNLVIFSSTGARQPGKGSALYSDTKAAGEAMVRAYALELGTRKIAVSSISPRPTDTPMLHPSFREIAAQSSPLGRLGDPDDQAGIVSFLMSEDACWITGQTLLVNGVYVMT